MRRRVLVDSIIKKLRNPSQKLPFDFFVRQIIPQVDTNISSQELLALLLTIAGSTNEPRWSALPPSPELYDQIKRQLETTQTFPFWPVKD